MCFNVGGQAEPRKSSPRSALQKKKKNGESSCHAYNMHVQTEAHSYTNTCHKATQPSAIFPFPDSLAQLSSTVAQRSKHKSCKLQSLPTHSHW